MGNPAGKDQIMSWVSKLGDMTHDGNSKSALTTIADKLKDQGMYVKSTIQSQSQLANLFKIAILLILEMLLKVLLVVIKMVWWQNYKVLQVNMV